MNLPSNFPRTPLIDVLWQKVSDIQPVQDGLLFTTSARAFPAKAIAETPGKERPVSLYHWTRANGGIAAAVDDTGPLFLPSPDGKRILYIDISPPTGNTPGKQELFVMNSNGSDSHLLLDLSAFSQLPMWPSWHGNDAISFIDLASIDLPSEAGKDPPYRIPTSLNTNSPPPTAFSSAKSLAKAGRWIVCHQ